MRSLASGEKVRAVVEALCIAHAHSVVSEWLTVSIGSATMVPQEIQTPNDLIMLADQRLYRAKQQGKNRVVWQDS